MPKTPSKKTFLLLGGEISLAVIVAANIGVICSDVSTGLAWSAVLIVLNLGWLIIGGHWIIKGSSLIAGTATFLVTSSPFIAAAIWLTNWGWPAIWWTLGAMFVAAFLLMLVAGCKLSPGAGVPPGPNAAK